MNLGIIYKNNKICNHRSLLKVLFNPFLRIMGIQIATLYFPYKDKLGHPVITKCEKQKLKFSFNFKLNENESIKKDRRII